MGQLDHLLDNNKAWADGIKHLSRRFFVPSP